MIFQELLNSFRLVWHWIHPTGRLQTICFDTSGCSLGFSVVLVIELSSPSKTDSGNGFGMKRELLNNQITSASTCVTAILTNSLYHQYWEFITWIHDSVTVPIPDRDFRCRYVLYLIVVFVITSCPNESLNLSFYCFTDLIDQNFHHKIFGISQSLAVFVNITDPTPSTPQNLCSLGPFFLDIDLFRCSIFAYLYGSGGLPRCGSSSSLRAVVKNAAEGPKMKYTSQEFIAWLFFDMTTVFFGIYDNIASRIEINSELISSPNPHNMAQAVWQEILCVSPASLS